MKTVIIYSSQTGSTHLIADLLAEKLAAKHEVQVVAGYEANLETIRYAELVVFAVPTYDEGQVEGMTRPLIEALAQESGLTQLFAVVAPGDSTYTHFAGAGDVIEAAATKAGMKRVVTTLKLDDYMMNMSASDEAIKAWVESLLNALS